MRDGLKRRIQGDKPHTLTVINKTNITKNVFNNRVTNSQCATADSCTSSRSNKSMFYSPPFRQPVRGWRKNLECNGNGGVDSRCWQHTEIYKDSYTHDQDGKCNPSNFGSLPNTNRPTGNEVRAVSGINSRTSRPLIRSGMQPNSAGQQNSGKPVVNVNNPKRYSYSYRELINNRRKDTVIKKQATSKPTNILYISGGSDTVMPGYGGECSDDNVGNARNCNYGAGTSVYRLNNSKFRVHGAVSASSRLDRLKLDTIRGETNCPPGLKTGPEDERSTCNGVYFAGKTRHQMGPANGLYSQRKYKYLFNNNHTEVNYPQENALVRARGAAGNRRNWGVCCNNDPPSFLM